VDKSVKDRNIIPAQVQELFKALYSVGFFEESVLAGSWVMPLYQELFGIQYVLKTLDIDFAVEIVRREGRRADLESILTGLGYLPVMSQSGIQKFTRSNFTVEFVAHRRGGREDEVFPIRRWNITAHPLPFLNILLDFTFTADFDDYKVRVPYPEAFFVHKLLIAQRRITKDKGKKDLEQCAVIASRIDAARLKTIVKTLKLSRTSRKAISASCEAIDFPPQNLGLDL
jgi:hypothetical protein